MKRYLYSLLAFIIFWLPSLRNFAKSPSPVSKNTAEWTIMVFMNGDNNLEECALQNFAQMANVSNSDKVNILVLFDRIPGGAVTKPDWTDTKCFKIAYGSQPLPKYALTTYKTTSKTSEENMGSPATIRNFVTWCMNNYPAKNFMLDIWDHGQGYRFELSQLIGGDARITTKAKGASKRLMAERSANQSPFRSCSNDDTDKDQLYNIEIREALTGLPHKINLIGFDCCFMSMVETTYAMRDLADIFVGSEEEEPGEGWKYDDWLQQLIDNPSIDAESLGHVLVSSYRNTYSTFNPATTMSEINLNGIAEVNNYITTLSKALMVNFSSEKDHIGTARENCSTYTPDGQFYHIDMIRFCEQLESLSTNTDIISSAQDVINILKEHRLDNYAGKSRQGTFGSNGYAIYFPPGNEAYQTDPYAKAAPGDENGYERSNTKYPVEFVKDCDWTLFLHKYFTYVH